MRAIVNVNKNSAYSYLNGLTFEVIEILYSVVALDVNDNTVDFSFSEVFIVDIQNEYMLSKDTTNFSNLSKYITSKKIQL
jgi:hypothetical protein